MAIFIGVSGFTESKCVQKSGGKPLSRNKATASGKREIPYYNSWSFSLQIGCTIGPLFPGKMQFAGPDKQYRPWCAAYAAVKPARCL
jgi:hypothetical protein